MSDDWVQGFLVGYVLGIGFVMLLRALRRKE